jgi:hypothetical protein
VFGAGTIQWSWGLDRNHDNRAGAPVGDPDVRIQQATVNLFADMGVQPQTLRSNLRKATASSDTRAPTSRITSPIAGTTVGRGQPIPIAGTATDVGGGVVGGVEVSVDGGNSWRPATGRGNWTYPWVPTGLGARTIRVAAVDDSGNLESPGASISVNIVAGAGPAQIWGDALGPAIASANDPNAVEVGVKFASEVSGSITGIRFYKGPQNTGVHTGHLWRGNGTLLATVRFDNETASGWQRANFPSPVPINANTTYVASYHTESGHYALTPNYFSNSGFDNAPLRALRDGVDGPNGVYVYGRSGFPLFPSSSFQGANYWVDVEFVPSSGSQKRTTIWAKTAVPDTASVDDPQPIELGTKFRTDVDGRVTALRFFKGSANTGPHVGHLWSGDGKLLASAPFKNQTIVGWQQVELDPPVAVKAGSPYIASYHTGSGNYAINVDDFAAEAVDSPPLYAMRNGEDGPSSLYRYGASGFPTGIRSKANFWVDVVFEGNEPDPAEKAENYSPRQKSVLLFPDGVDRNKKKPQQADPLEPEARSFLNGGHPVSPTGR